MTNLLEVRRRQLRFSNREGANGEAHFDLNSQDFDRLLLAFLGPIETPQLNCSVDSLAGNASVEDSGIGKGQEPSLLSKI